MMGDALREVFQRLGPEAGALFDEPMRKHTFLRIGGPADVYAVPRDAGALGAVLRAAAEAGAPVTPVGGGTNLLVGDGGVRGVVVSLDSFRDMKVVSEDSSHALVSVGAGVPLGKLVDFTRTQGMGGVEALAGIPGQVGGAISCNAGAYGVEIKDVLASVHVMLGDGSLHTLLPGEVRFVYRRAEFPEGSVILGAEMRFLKDSAGDVAARVEEFLRKKKTSQPIGRRSAGCVFKNPPDGAPAGKLIDDAGCKGMAVGDIVVSTTHANFFINKGEGTAEQYARLMDTVSGRVREAFGVVLEPEVRVVGQC